MILFVFTLLFFFRGHGDGGAAAENDYLMVIGSLRRLVGVFGFINRTASVEGEIHRTIDVKSER